jgi:hypothetical protein
MSERDLIGGIVGISLIGAMWAIFGYNTWEHIYLTLAGLLIFIGCYAWTKVFPRREPPSSE